MAENNILEELRAKLTDSPEDNNEFLRKEGERFAKEGNVEGVEAVTKLIIEIMPQSQKEEVERLTHLDGERLDQVQAKIVKLVGEKDLNEAKNLAERLYKKIMLDYKEGETAKFVSLRNPFEDNLYQLRCLLHMHISLLRWAHLLTLSPYWSRLWTSIPLTAVPDLSWRRYTSS